jgi:hypothetical protein
LQLKSPAATYKHPGIVHGERRLDYFLAPSSMMAHLKDAIAQYVDQHPRSTMREDLLVLHEKVIRVMKHLISDFGVNLDTIRAFNTRGVLSSMEYLKNGKSRKSRKSRKTRKSRK